MIVKRKNKVKDPPGSCPMMECMNIIGGNWTPNIIWYLSAQPRRFSELQDDITGISPKVLTDRLKNLQKNGIIHRRVMPTSPPTVEYSLTELGQELKPAIEAIVNVGKRLKEINKQ